MANIGSINRRADLSKKLSILSPDELRDLVCRKVRHLASNDPWTDISSSYRLFPCYLVFIYALIVFFLFLFPLIF